MWDAMLPFVFFFFVLFWMRLRPADFRIIPRYQICIGFAVLVPLTIIPLLILLVPRAHVAPAVPVLAAPAPPALEMPPPVEIP
jgi:hypothetical protein